VDLVLTGSIAFDYIMRFPGRFADHILPDRLDSLSLSFLVDTLDKRPGGIAANIAYSLALLGEQPRVMATVGEDFESYGRFLEGQGVRIAEIVTIPDTHTASFFVTTDETDAQIASFYTGAMAHAAGLKLADLDPTPGLVFISPNDPRAMVSYASECRGLKIPYIYDPSQQILRLEGIELAEGIQGSEALFANDYELALILGKTDLSLDRIAAETRFTVITRGERGSEIVTREARLQIPPVVPRGPAEPTGVGDAYRAGFLKGYAHGLPLEWCGRMGSLAATYCLESMGPQGHQYDLKQFIARFEQEFGPQWKLSDRLS
jgi:adenosine kinase